MLAVTPVPAGPQSVARQTAQCWPADLDSIVGAVIAGDLRARERLLAEIHPHILRYCRGRIGRRETAVGSAEDIAQEVCLAVIAALTTYTLKGLSFRAFVYGIAAHKVADVYRAAKRNRVELMAELPDAPATDRGPEQRVLAAEASDKLRELLDTLNDRQREVVVLRVAVGLSAEDTAQAVRSTPGAVRVIQHRALNRLRDALAGADIGPPSCLGSAASV